MQDKAGTIRWKTSMISLRLCWPIFALWYMYQGTMSHLVSTQMKSKKFEIESGLHCEKEDQITHTCRSLVECALMCVNDISCSNFNFGSGQCELLSVADFCRTNAPGWVHGYYANGKYKNTRSLTICFPCPSNVYLYAANS